MDRKPFGGKVRSRIHSHRFDEIGEPVPQPAELRKEGGQLVMLIHGVRHIGKKTPSGFFWVPETEEQ